MNSIYYIFPKLEVSVTEVHSLWKSEGGLDFISFSSIPQLVSLLFSFALVIYIFGRVMKAFKAKSDGVSTLRDVAIAIVIIIVVREATLSLL